LSSRILSNIRSAPVISALRTLAVSLTLMLILLLHPGAASAEEKATTVVNQGIYQTTAYKKKRVYRKRKYRRKKSTRRRSRKARKPVVAWPRGEALKGPVQIVVSLPHQRMTLYKGGQKIASSRVSTGKAGHRTPAGIFSIIQKHRQHFSNLYGGAPMPNMQRITWSGVAMHAGSLPGYPASHGCIRLPYSFSRKLFGYTQMGNHVIVARDMVKPQFISHASLFQPIPSTDQVGPRVILDKQTDAAPFLKPQNTPLISDLASNQGKLTNTAVTGSDIVEATNPVVTTDLAIVKRQVNTPATTTQSVLRKHLIQKMRDRQWPRDAQRLLKKLGVYRGNVDGDAGRATIRAVRSFQSRMGMPVTGKIDKNLILTLNRISGKTIDLSFENVKLPKANAPLRILITRKKEAQTAKIAQELLNILAYDTGGIDGQLGSMSKAAIRDFQRDKGLPVTGTLSKHVMNALYQATGRKKPGQWHLYVRQEFLDMFDAPIDIRDPGQPIGTHLFTAMHFDKDATETKWTALTMRASSGKGKRKCRWNRRKKRRTCHTTPAPVVTSISANEVLDRVEIPEDIKSVVSELLTPGSSMVVTDKGISYETGKGTDFIVLTR